MPLRRQTETIIMIEYKVRPVTRYVVTRFEGQTSNADGSCKCGSSTHGEFDNSETAYAVAYALCRLEHEKSGEPLDSMNFIYPTDPTVTAMRAD